MVHSTFGRMCAFSPWKAASATEQWANGRGMCVVRVLQQDVWDDHRHWDTWLKESIEAARTGEARVLTPPLVPEYTSSDSVYMQLRTPK